MRITPLDIYQQEFKRVLRGFDPDEVEDFLERVADDYEQVIKDNSVLKERIESLKAQLTAGGKSEQADSKAAAREDATSIIREAKKEADSIIRKAREEADNIVRKAQIGAAEALETRPETEEVPEEVFRQQIDLLLEEAKKKAKKLIEEARMEELELRREISKLRGQKENFLIEYRELLEKHLRILSEKL